MLVWLAIFVALGLGSLVAARYLAAPAWVDALMSCFLFAGLAVGTAAGLLVRRLTPAWKAPASLLLGLAAALGRFSLLGWVARRPRATTVIAVPELLLALGTVAWALLALLWGAAALAEAVDPAWTVRGRMGRRLLAGTSGVAVALALYALAPLGQLLGLRVNHWTLLGLFALAAVAYGISRLYARLTGPR